MKKLLINVNVRCFIIVICAVVFNYRMENGGFDLFQLIPIFLAIESACLLIAQSCDSSKTDFSISRIYSVEAKPFLKRCCFCLWIWAGVYIGYVYYAIQTYTYKELITALMGGGLCLFGALCMNFVAINVSKEDERTTLKTMDLDWILPWFHSKYVRLRKWLRGDS